ncbi:MAG: metal ABC transporter solute-binding protein, Zn/Mn family [Candidatus Latescibacterota bacterium]
MKHLFWGLVCLLVFVACGAGQDQKGDGFHVVCTTGMIGDLVQNIAGERAKVVSLMGPGIDPHYYKATQGDLAKLSTADVIFYNGLFLEGKMEDIFEKMAKSKTVVAVSKHIDESRFRRPKGAQGEHDPHIWFDVALWSETIDTVVDVLSKADPQGKDQFLKNGVRYKKELLDLDAWVKKEILTIPKQQRVLITAHDAFGYFGLAYDIEVRGLQGISTVAEYGVNDVSQLVQFIVDNKVKALFVESSVPERSINAVREGCKSRGWDVVVGGTLYSDAMGAVGSGADTYVGMVRANVNAIVKGLR